MSKKPEPSDPLERHIEWFVEEGWEVAELDLDSARMRKPSSFMGRLGNFFKNLLVWSPDRPRYEAAPSFELEEDTFYLRVEDGKVKLEMMNVRTNRRVFPEEVCSTRKETPPVSRVQEVSERAARGRNPDSTIKVSV